MTIDNILQLQEICRNTFAETFYSNNSEEYMKEYLDNAFATERLKVELSDQNSQFFFATLKDKIIGYLKINMGQSQTENKDENALEIERIYVLKEFHGKKVGQLLYEKAIEISKQTTVDYIWLGVWEKNTRAIRFYKKNSFEEFGKHIFTLGTDEQTDIMMRRKISFENF